MQSCRQRLVLFRRLWFECDLRTSFSRIDAARLPLQMILVCGKNEKTCWLGLTRRQKWNLPLHIVGIYTREGQAPDERRGFF